MNNIQKINIQKRINTNLTSMDSTLSNLNTSNETVITQLSNLNATNETVISQLSSMNSHLNDIEDYIADIGVSISRIHTRDKIYISGKLTDGTNDYLDKIDYTSSPIYFNWTNPYTYPVYITEYTFRYHHNTNDEPNWNELYHCATPWTTKIGKMNNTGDDMDSISYYEINNNLEMMWDYVSQPKRSFISDDNMWIWAHSFRDAPIKIEPNQKFGHYIGGDFSSSSIYNSNPIGNIQGYMYE